MNEQTIGNAQLLIERLGHSDEGLRRRIAELEEENRLLKGGLYRADEYARAIDTEIPLLESDDHSNAVVAKRLLALPADALIEHEGLNAWYAAFKERERIAPENVPDDLAGPLIALCRVLD